MQQLVGTGMIVLALDAHQYQQSLIDGTNHLACDLDPCLTYTLDQRFHRWAAPSGVCRRQIEQAVGDLTGRPYQRIGNA